MKGKGTKTIVVPSGTVVIYTAVLDAWTGKQAKDGKKKGGKNEP